MERLDRLESLESISQLVARHAVAYDARDLEALAQVYAPAVRAAAMAELEAHLPPGVTFTLVAPPVVSFQGDDVAMGAVTCRAEREDGEQWLVAGVSFADRYVRQDGTWYLAARVSTVLYEADVLSRP